MTALKLSEFFGTWPLRDPRSLPDQQATEALDMWPDGSGLHGVAPPRPLVALLSSTRRVYRIPTGDETDLTQSFWMQFPDRDTDVVRGPTVNDSFQRFYWASPSTGLKYATKAEILAGGAVYDVGVAGPLVAPRLTVVAGSAPIDPGTGKPKGMIVTRSYTVTFTSIFGEESQPGPTAEGNGYDTADWLLQSIPQPVTGTGKVPVSKITIYRTVTGTDGTTTFFKVADIVPGTTTYTDRLTDLVVTGAKQIESTNWNRPPSGLQGLVMMANGIMAGWIDNNVYFSENYRPHAWPAEYVLAVEHPIVGLGVYQNSLVVLTKGKPVIITGSVSSNMSMSANGAALPCLSRRSIVSSEAGVLFATETGLILIGPGGVQRISDQLIGRDKWSSVFQPKTLRAIVLEGMYVAVRDNGKPDQAFAFRPDDAAKGLVYLSTKGYGVDVAVDVWSGKATLIADAQLYQWMPAGDETGAFRWRSKEFQLERPLNFSVAQVFYDPRPGESVRLRVWAVQRGAKAQAKRLVFDYDVASVPGREIRLPSGFMADTWQFEVEANVRVHNLYVSTSVAELKNG